MTNRKISSATSCPVRNRLPAHQYKLGPVEYRSTGSLVSYDHNPRKHPEKQIIKLMASINEFGFAMPVLVDGEGVIIAGHARVTAALRLSLPEVPVIVAHQWSRAQVRAYRLADNRLAELASWDLDSLAVEFAAIVEFDETPVELLGWEASELALIRAPSVNEGRDNPVEELPKLPGAATSSPGDLWQLGNHRLLCGSSLKSSNWDRLMHRITAAMAFSSWPSGICESGKTIDPTRIYTKDWDRPWSKEPEPRTGNVRAVVKGMAANLKNGGILMLTMDWQHSPPVLAAIDHFLLSMLHMCVLNTASAAQGPLYDNCHELLWIAKKGNAPHANHVEQNYKGGRRSDVWDCGAGNSDNQPNTATPGRWRGHMPISLVEDVIKDVTSAGEIVVDAFVGTGTTILAAERTGRYAYGMEREPRLVDTAILRWETLTGQAAQLAESGEDFASVAVRRRTSGRR